MFLIVLFIGRSQIIVIYQRFCLFNLDLSLLFLISVGAKLFELIEQGIILIINSFKAMSN